MDDPSKNGPKRAVPLDEKSVHKLAGAGADALATTLPEPDAPPKPPVAAVMDLAAHRTGRASPAADVKPPSAPGRVLGVPLTHYAEKATSLAEHINRELATVSVGRKQPRFPRCAVPEGMSTDGGRRARQSLVLMAEGVAPVVFGFVDVSHLEAEVRDYRVIRTTLLERAKTEWDVTQGEYTAMLARVRTALELAGISVRDGRAAAEDDRKTKGSGTGTAWLGWALAALVLVAALLLLL